MDYMMRYALITILLSAALPAIAQDSAAPDEPTVSLPVPFVLQAPLGDWSWPWQDFCEEASVLAAMTYIQNRNLALYEKANELLELSKFELKTIGYEKDTNLRDTERMIREYYRYPFTRILESPTADDIKREIAAGNPVLVPLAGGLLANPHFTSPPRYHMVVIKGFDDAHFIAQEPGTRFGENYRYEISRLMNAIHDFVPTGNITQSPSRALVVLKNPPPPIEPATADNSSRSPLWKILGIVTFPLSVLGWL